jgi:hypothetical protein
VIDEFFRIGPLVPECEPSGIELTDPRCAGFAVPREATAQDAPSGSVPGFAEAPAGALAEFASSRRPSQWWCRD